jgi:hypothetical protein
MYTVFDCYPIFKVLAATYCDNNMEINHISGEEWVLLLFYMKVRKKKGKAIPVTGCEGP